MKRVKNFKYLGCTFTENGRMEDEVLARDVTGKLVSCVATAAAGLVRQ